MRLGYKMPDGETATRGRPRREDVRAARSDFSSLGLAHLAVICQGGATPNSVHFVVQFRILQGMSAAARAHHATLHIEYLPDDEFHGLVDSDKWPAVIRERFVAGIVILGLPQAATIRSLQSAMPCICFQRGAGTAATDSVSEDNYGSMYQLFEHLTQLGHRRIGMADFGYNSHSYRARYGAYMQSLLEWHLPIDAADSIFPKHAPDMPDEAAAVEVSEHILKRYHEQKVSAWVCQNDHQGYLLVRQLQNRGLRVPEDISICGFDHFAPPEGLPAMTSIDGAFEAMGAAAVSRLLGRIMSPTIEPVNMLLDTKLFIGQSTGPARF